ncbi:hypothetical protein [Motilimonas eburnea]|uniref:hypothetical protein n=1 Tax=Motilimonas eburnea TaxID=1737488 RepID=UPI001E40BAA1|nr:hypothetical protein [Motilimonas eburnea]MCE2572806.1 hypothetical protein [Motilimonas eburnea]
MMKNKLLLSLCLVTPFGFAAGVSDYNLVLAAGQSLSVGHTNVELNPQINYGPVNKDKVFLFTGVRAIGPYSNQKLSSSDVTSLVPLEEKTRETHAYAMFAKLEKLYKLNNLDFPKFVYAPHARGGKKIIDLAYGTEPFQNGETMISAAENLTAASGEQFNVPFMTWIHGESNAKTNPEEYKTDLRKLHNSYKQVVSNTSSETKTPLLFMDQTGVSYGHDIAIASWEFANDYQEAVLVTPKYHLNRLYYNSNTDRTHLNPKGYILQGEYFAKAIYSTLVQNKRWKPLQPESIYVNNNEVSITMHVPEGNMVIDTSTLPEAPGYGFRYITVDNRELIPSVSIDKKTIKLVFNEKIEVGGRIDAGFTANDRSLTGNQKTPLTNIRDTSSVLSSIDDTPLHNWMVQFAFDVTAITPGMANNIDVPHASNIWTFGDLSANNVAPFKLLAGNYEKNNFESALYRVSFKANVREGVALFSIGDKSYPVQESGEYTFVTNLCEPSRERLAVLNSYKNFSGVLHNIQLKPIYLGTSLNGSNESVVGSNIWPNSIDITNFESDPYSLIGGSHLKAGLTHSLYLLSYDASVDTGEALINVGDYQHRVNSTGLFTDIVPVCNPSYSRLRFQSGRLGFTGTILDINVTEI